MPDRTGFEAFASARADRLLRAGYLLTRDWALAEDLVQTALTKVWQRWSHVDDPDAYVWRTLTTTYTSWWRRRWNGEVPTETLPEHAGTDTDIDTRTDLWQALAALPRRQRAVLVLRYYVDLTEVQTADVLGCSVGTVKSHTSKALAHLRVDPTLQPDRVERPAFDTAVAGSAAPQPEPLPTGGDA